MRIHRLLLENYRGTGRREVEFLPTGVTVVQGPNEVGKTSLAEAFDLLLEFHDASTDRRVKAIKPVDADVGSLIEADLELGGLTFTYRKRFFKARETLLQITAPVVETVTGRDAHDRVKALVERHVDEGLWKALRVRQGHELAQADISAAGSLAAALDQAAGLAAAGDEEIALIDKARSEYERYFTPSGRDGAALRDASDEVAAATELVAKYQQTLRDLEEQAVECTALERSVSNLGGRLEAARRSLDERQSRWNEIMDRTSNLQQLRLELQTARARRDEVVSRAAVRRRLIDDVDRLSAAIEDTGRSLETWRHALSEISERHTAAAAAVHVAEANADEARSRLELRQRQFEHRRDAFDLEVLMERRARISAAIDDQAAAAEILGSGRVDADSLAAIRSAHVAVQTCRAAFEAAAPRVRVAARAPIRLTIGGRHVDLAAGEVTEHNVGDSLVFDMGEVEIKVEPGAGADPDKLRVGDAEKTLHRLLSDAGVSDIAGAEVAFERRREAERRTVDAERIIDESLRDLTLDEMDAKIGGLSRIVSHYEQHADADEGGASTHEEARRLRDETAAAWRVAEEERVRLAGEAEALRREVDSLDVQRREAEAGVDAARSHLAATLSSLERERSVISDEALAREVDVAVQAYAHAEAAYIASEQVLARMDPETARVLVEQAEAAVADTQSRLSQEQERLRDLRAALKARGEEGLHDRLEDSRARLEHAEIERARIMKRAEAARLLLDTLTRHRDATRRAYVAPLREQIQRLGRVVFGETFDVELGEDLQIVSRLLDGRKVPFDSLSAGTREQLAIIERLAASILVAGHEGAPVILDDSLGYSDEQRLAAMGAVLALAGRDCQVIVLTCYPERYGHVAGAQVLALT